MAAINADHLNVFLMATSKILQDMCGFNPKIGKPAVSKLEFSDDTIVIMIGVTGEMRGQVMLSFEDPIACDIAGKMMMMPVQELDEISTSAICELGNMIMGNASTVFSVEGIGIDILGYQNRSLL
jgi:chemotaxis protein CheX